MGKNTAPHYKTKQYFTLDDYKTAFIVRVTGNAVAVTFKRGGSEEVLEIPVLTFKTEKYWVGQDIYDDNREMDGNALLFKLSSKKYFFIGKEMYFFQPEAQIVSFASPVEDGNAFPFAIDSQNNAYLFNEDVILENYVPTYNGEITTLENADEDPYQLFHSLTQGHPRAKQYMRKIRILDQ